MLKLLLTYLLPNSTIILTKIFIEDKMNAQVIYNFPELAQRINDLSPTIIQLINQHNLNGLQQIVASYDQSVTDMATV